MESLTPGFSASEATALADAFTASFCSDILGFWRARAVDPTGGYRVAWSADGTPTRDERGIVSQSRLVYVFARAARAGIEPDESLAAANHGFAYLRDALWDERHGGFRWTLDDPRKVTYGQAFALFGLSELVRAGGDPDAGGLAVALMDKLDTHVRDRRNGGYREVLAPDWSTLGRDARSPIDHHRMRTKTINSHLHVLEAMVAALRAGIDARAGERARELLEVLVLRAGRRRRGLLADSWTPAWRPRRSDRSVGYGHAIELSWMLLDALDALEASDALAGPRSPGAGLQTAVHAAATFLVVEVDHQGVSPDHGGIWRRGRLGAGVTEPVFDHWAQAEALLAWAWWLRATGDPHYADRLRALWTFVSERVADTRVGEWHDVLGADLRPQGPKGGLWKAGYHATRALLDGSAVLREVARTATAPATD